MLLWAALLAPAAELLPMVTVSVAGKGGWICILVAAPVMALAGLAVFRLCRSGEGLGESYLRLFGPVFGRGILLIYIVWGWFLLVLRLRLGAQRLMGAGYRDGSLWFLLPVLAAMALWMSWGKLSAFARAGEVFFAALALTAVVVALLTAGQMRPEHLLPLWKEDVVPILKGGIPATGVLCYGIYAAFLSGDTQWKKGDVGRWVRWTILGCGALSLMQMVVIGNFGPGLIEKLDSPFFNLAKSVGVKGAFQRVESVVAAVWTFSDLAIMGLLLRALAKGMQGVAPKVKGELAAAAFLIPGAIAALIFFPGGVVAEEMSRGTVLWGNLILGLLLPVLLLVIQRIRQK